MQNQLQFSGNAIDLEKSAGHYAKSYSIAFEAEVFMEQDSSKDCENYPNSLYEAYYVSYSYSRQQTLRI